MSTTRRAFVVAGLLAGFVSTAQAVSPPTPEEVTAFFRAVQTDDAGTVRKMVGARVNANELNPIGGDTALVLAVREDAKEVVQALLLARRAEQLEELEIGLGAAR